MKTKTAVEQSDIKKYFHKVMETETETTWIRPEDIGCIILFRPEKKSAIITLEEKNKCQLLMKYGKALVAEPELIKSLVDPEEYEQAMTMNSIFLN